MGKFNYFLLLIILTISFCCGCSQEKETEEPPASSAEQTEETAFVAPSPLAEGSNGINNIGCAGLSCQADDVTYYVKEDEKGSGYGTIHAITADGSDTLLYTSRGNIEYLTATTDKLWFTVTLYNANGHFDGDLCCSMDRTSNEVKEHFTCEDRIISLSVTTSGIYLCTTAERSGSKIQLTDDTGRDPQTLWEQDDIISDCIFSGDSIYFIANNRLWQCSRNGENRRELASSLYMLSTPMVVGETIYYVDYDSYLAPTLYALRPNGTATPLISYGESIRISALNYDADKLYLVKSTVDVDGNTLQAAIVTLNPDGNDERELFSGDTEVYGLSLSDQTVFFYDLAKGQAIRQKIE